MNEPSPRTPLGERLHVPVDEARLARGWSRIEARALRPSRARPLALAVALAAAALFVVARARSPAAPETPGPLALREARAGLTLEAALREGGARGAPVALSDGSVIHLAPGASLEALENTGGRMQFMLRRGRARFSVQPGGPRRWTVEAGALSVEVVGTVFSVDRDGPTVRVAVERGRVLVRGDAVPDRVRALNVGESLQVPPAALAARAPAALTPPVAARAAPPSPVIAAPARPAPAGGVAPAVSVTSLLAQADEARRAGRTDEALRRLSQASRRDGDPSAALASYTRGRLLLELRRFAEAARDLRQGLRQGLPPALDESARARLVEALARQGDRGEAAQAAADYRRRYPQGEWRERVGGWSP